MHMANEQYQQNNHKWQTFQLGLETLERYWASFQVTILFHSATIFSNSLIIRMERVFIFSFFYLFIYLFISFIFDYLFIYLFCFFWGGGGAQLQCIYFLVLYTDLKAAEGI